MANAPVFLLTMGDPAGIGPEIAVRALCGGRPLRDAERATDARIVVVGDLDVLEKAAYVCRGESPPLKAEFNVVSDPDDAVDAPHTVNVIDMGEIDTPRFNPGAPQASCGLAAYRYIIRAIELTMAGKAAGVVTNPISKESLKLAGINYPGHTEIFADKTGAESYSMVFLLDGVAVAHVTTHVSLRNAIDLITKDRVLGQIKLLHRSLKGLGIDPPRMAVAGLNPHAGENGLFGDEEIREIIPAVEEARGLGIDIAGPLPPDTVFSRAFEGEFNGVVSMLHDHGFVALKSRDFDHGVNITVGLPIIRTSVGHGTAFDRAWKGTASPASLISAIDAAVKMNSFARAGGKPQ
ncbi:MAG: 4-hydroxythreonine-4-phosphate dehydrogenase PdxA [Chitinispirillia bacterium]|nr:4-hydroxythreonine-4-phosphate dehydrogenase PdxA [Chitinispirillia bacterium]MCL2269640.1 4-hydroxythreonine-4-phosphate dehydrogenase PdxA [Chitinispirillia bacterium]